MKKNYLLFSLVFMTFGLFAQGGNSFYPPQNLTGTIENDTIIHVSWDEPGNGAQWINWDSSEYFTSVGLINGGTFYAASRWTTEELTGFENYYLTKISFFPTNDSNAFYSLKIWQGENASNLILSQDVESFTLNEWNEVMINNPIQINTEEELWFGFSVSQQAGYGVAGVDAGPAKMGKGDYISLDGTSWNELPNIGYNYNWNLRGFLSFNANGKNFINPQQEQEVTNSPVSFDKNLFLLEEAKEVNSTFAFNNEKSIFQYYRLIHKLDGGSWEFLDNVTETSYDYSFNEEGTHFFMVYTIYEGGESLPEGPSIINTNENGIDENNNFNVLIFPNPTSQFLHISSKEPIENISIYNSIGVLVRKYESLDKAGKINLVNLSEGTYLIKIKSSKGTSTRKLLIVK